MPQSDLISLPRVLSRLPRLCVGLPKRIKGLLLAGRNLDEEEAGLRYCLEQAVANNPKGLAIAYEQRSISYEAFDQWANRIANYLRDTGTAHGDVIIVMLENRPELLAVTAALAKLGAIPAFINTSQRGRVLQHSIELVSPSRVIGGTEVIDALNEVADCLPRGAEQRLCLADVDTLIDAGQVPATWTNLARHVAPQSNRLATPYKARGKDPFCYFYTSGTTGLPKAAVLSNGRYMKAFGGVGLASVQLNASDRVFVPLPFYHGTAMVIGWGSALAGSAGLVMTRQFSARNFWNLVREHDVSAFCYVGELCRYLLSQPASPADRQHAVRVMFGNGLRPGIWQDFKQRFGIDCVLEFYGSSEGNVGFLNLLNFDATVGLTTVPYAIVEYDLEHDCPKRFGNGFMRKVRRGEAGLLLGEITKDSPFDGYTDAGKTENTILRNVFKAGDAWFNTGDLMRDQGCRHAQFVDRLGDTFRWKGENVSTTEVENVLTALPGVSEAVVYGVEVPHTNGRAGMVAIRSEHESFDPNTLLPAMRETLAPYAIPLFVRQVQQMQTTGTHKYQKTLLKKEGFSAAAGDTVWVLLPGESSYVPLSDEIQARIANGQCRF